MEADYIGEEVSGGAKGLCTSEGLINLQEISKDKVKL